MSYTENTAQNTASTLAHIRKELEHYLSPLNGLVRHEGIRTQLPSLDNYLFWNGLPKSELSLFMGVPGAGASSLWLKCAETLIQENKSVAWVNSDAWLLPNHLRLKNLDLNKVFVVHKPKDATQLFWILQEMITSGVFALIGCHLSDLQLKVSYLQKLKRLAKSYQVTLVFLTQKIRQSLHSLFSVILQFEKFQLTVTRAQHRPTPFTLSQESWNANPLLELKTPTHP